METISKSKIRIVAIDCATKPKRVGLCAGWLRGDDLHVDEVLRGDAVESMAAWVAERSAECTNVVLGLDAPLGWPAPMVDGLRGHRAGVLLQGESNHLFRRGTDTFVHREIGKLPLDVGADRIARTAHSALELLHAVRQESGLAFDVPVEEYSGGTAAIETYPGGTLRAGPWDDRGYKGKAGKAKRAELIEALSQVITFEVATEPLIANDDLFDAVIAGLGVVDYLTGRCFEPYDATLAEREGWIWVRRPETSTAR